MLPRKALAAIAPPEAATQVMVAMAADVIEPLAIAVVRFSSDRRAHHAADSACAASQLRIRYWDCHEPPSRELFVKARESAHLPTLSGPIPELQYGAEVPSSAVTQDQMHDHSLA